MVPVGLFSSSCTVHTIAALHKQRLSFFPFLNHHFFIPKPAKGLRALWVVLKIKCRKGQSIWFKAWHTVKAQSMFFSFSHMPSRETHVFCILFLQTADRLRFCAVLSTVMVGWGWRLQRKCSWTLVSNYPLKVTPQRRFFFYFYRRQWQQPTCLCWLPG